MSTCDVCPPEANCPGPEFKHCPDDVRGHFDATDGAHPAWWRGYDRGFDDSARCLERTITDPVRDMRDCAERTRPFTILRTKVATLAINDGCLRAELKERDRTIEGLRKELAEAKRALTLFAARVRRDGLV